MAVVAMKQLLEAGVHFGHQTKRWDPKMAEYIYQARNGIHIIDLQKTSKKIDEAYAFVKEIAEEGQDILFVGTKNKHKNVLKKLLKKAVCLCRSKMVRWNAYKLQKQLEQELKDLKIRSYGTRWNI